MNTQKEEKLSRLMSFILRHKPEDVGIKLAQDGSCTIEELVSAVNKQNKWSGVTSDDIRQVAKNCSKQRYKIEGERIKANYGHSSIKISRTASIPPGVLYHGTNTKIINTIMNEGIKPMGRDVHMSEGREFAELAAERRGVPVILIVDSGTAHKDGIEFFSAGHGVWLSGPIPTKYLKIEE